MMKFARIVFLVAGIYGVIIIAPLYLAEGWLNSMFPPAINHPEYYYGFVGLTLAWQILFLVLSRDPVRYRAMMLPSFVEKITYVLAITTLFFQHRVPSALLPTEGIDLLLGILFLAAFFVTAPSRIQQNATPQSKVA